MIEDDGAEKHDESDEEQAIGCWKGVNPNLGTSIELKTGQKLMPILMITPL